MLDNAIHPRVKLGILTAIARRPMFPFIELAMWIGSTTSRLSTAIRELVRDGMIDVKKGYERNRPITQYSLSPEGEARLRVYLEHLAQIVNHSGLATVALKRD